jgi:hypothetical protein
MNLPSAVRELMQSKIKSKEKTGRLIQLIQNDNDHLQEIIDILQTGSDVDKGTCADILKHISNDSPDIVLPHLDILIDFINYKAPRVKWGIPESIGNLAQKYPRQAARAIPKLLLNTKEESTVVRWCAAFALSEIVKHDIDSRKELVPTFKKILEKEQNNGVKNVYLKALKFIEKIG